MVSVPEATINKDTGPVFSQDQIWMPRQPFMIQPVSETPLPQPMTHDQLRLSILRTDGSHVIVTLLLSKFIHSSRKVPPLQLLASSRPSGHQERHLYRGNHFAGKKHDGGNALRGYHKLLFLHLAMNESHLLSLLLVHQEVSGLALYT